MDGAILMTAMTDPVTKVCTTCGTERPLSEFYRKARERDGHRSQCKPCSKAVIAKYRAANKDRIAEKGREFWARCGHRYAKRARRRTYAGSSHETNVVKLASRHILKAARRLGKIERGPCEVCGAENVHGHHDDYGKPLEVRWLCPTHHREWHANNKAICPEEIPDDWPRWAKNMKAQQESAAA